MSAKSGRERSIVYAPAAVQDLDAIWAWNEKTYSRSHADKYLDFLQRQMDALGRNHLHGRAVESRPEIHYILIRRNRQGHGHVAVYRFEQNKIRILHVFHSAQDWQTIVADE
jgi:plasmid stabilization system protein ParE